MTQTPIAAWEDIPAPELARLEQMYMLRDRPKILRFLGAYRLLLPILLQAPPRIRDYFPAVPLALEVLTDPDPVEDEQLLLSIGASFPPDQALARLQQLDEGWWLAQVSQAQGKLCIDVEYR